MNSEVPPISDDNSKFESTQPAEKPLEELKVESTSDFDDAWSEDDVDEVIDVVDVTIESENESPQSDRSSTNSTIIEPDIAESDEATELITTEIASEQETELIEQPLRNTPEQNIEDPKSSAFTDDLEDIEQASNESSDEPELFVDSWLDELKSDPPPATPSQNTSLAGQDEEVNELEKQKAVLQNEIEALKVQKEQMLLQQVKEVRENMAQIVEEGTKELKERKARLQIEIEKLERRKDRINQEMRASFAGSSQELAVKVQGFKEYLVGSLQDLARAAEKLDLAKNEANSTRSSARVRSRDEGMPMGNPNRDRSRGVSRRDRQTRDTRDNRGSRSSNRNSIASASQGQFSEPTFADQSRRIRQLIDKYLNNPNYYGSPWQLRRTFEQIHAKKVQDWFFVQGGRGAVDSMGSRLQNILVASAAISILHSLYGDRCRVLVLTDTPENLGEWRRGLQDCLGISRANFGSNRGVTLFDSPEVAVQRAERLIEDKLLPVIIIDETDELLNLSVLKFPLWLAFASSNKQSASNYLY